MGKILYLTKKVEPTCANAIRELSSFLDNPSQDHWKSVMRLVGYLKQYNRPLKMRPPTDLRIHGSVDSDWASDQNDRKSIGGYLITIGGCLVDWSSKKQNTIALSSTEAEYMAFSDASSSIKYIHMLVTEVYGNCPKPAVLMEDNTGAIHLVNNEHIGKRTKHIDVRYRFVNALVKEGLLIGKYIKSEENPADIMTKNVTELLFTKHSKKIYEGLLFKSSEDGGCPPNKEDVKDMGLCVRVKDIGFCVGPNEGHVRSDVRVSIIGKETNVGHTFNLGCRDRLLEDTLCLDVQPPESEWMVVERGNKKKYGKKSEKWILNPKDLFSVASN